MLASKYQITNSYRNIDSNDMISWLQINKNQRNTNLNLQGIEIYI